MKKLVIFFCGIICGIVLVFGGIAGVGYYLLTTQTLGDVEKLLGTKDIIAPTDKDKQTLLKDFVLGSISALQEIDRITLSALEEAIGTTAITHALNSVLGIDPAISGNSKLADLPDVIMDGLTLSKISQTFKFTLPDFPIFKDKEFLKKPIVDALSSLSDQKLSAFIAIDNDSSPMLIKLGDKKLSDLSNDMDGIINDMYLSDIITDAPEGSLISKFLTLKIGEMGTEADGVINSLEMRELMTIDENSPQLFQAIEHSTLLTIQDDIQALQLKELIDVGSEPIWTKLGEATLDNLGSVVDGLLLTDVIKIEEDDPDANIILKKLAFRKELDEETGETVVVGTKVSDIGLYMNSIVETTTIGELLGIDENDTTVEPILLALVNTCLNADDLNDTLKELKVYQVFKDCDSGMLSLVPEDTLISELPLKLSQAVAETNIYKLEQLGVYNAGLDGSSNLIKSYIYNLSIEKLTTDFVDSLNNPFNTNTPVYVLLLDTGDAAITEITADLIARYASIFTKGFTLVLQDDTTLQAGTYEYLFNIDCNGHTLTIEDEVSVILDNNGSGYMYIEDFNASESEFLIKTTTFKLSDKENDTAPSVKVDYTTIRDFRP